MKAAKIINSFGHEFIVPLWKAKKMLINEQIENYETVEVTRLLNAQKPETQEEFNRRMAGQQLGDENTKKENLELTKALIEAQKELNNLRKAGNVVNTTTKTEEIIKNKYKEIYGKDVPNNKKNDLEWIENKIKTNENKGEIVIEETIEAPKNPVAP